MTAERSLAALQWRRPSCVPSEKTARCRRPLMPSFVNSREFSLIPREFRASVPPCTAPAALYFQGDPQNRRGGGGGVTYGKALNTFLWSAQQLRAQLLSPRPRPATP